MSNVVTCTSCGCGFEAPSEEDAIEAAHKKTCLCYWCAKELRMDMAEAQAEARQDVKDLEAWEAAAQRADHQRDVELDERAEAQAKAGRGTA